MRQPSKSKSELVRELENFRERVVELEIREIERREMDKALLENHWTLSSLVNSLMGIAYRRRVDPTWTMEYVSEGCQELTGYKASDLIMNKKLPYGDLVYGADRTKVETEIKTAVKRELPYSLTYRIKTAAGGEKWVWEQGRGYHLSEGKMSVTEGFISDVTDQKNVEDKLLQSAAYDSLTGLLNRAHLTKLLRAEIHAAKRHGHPISICFSDLDDFRKINEAYGKQVGNEILSSFGSLIKQELRTEDISARYGNDEFCMVLPFTTAAKAVVGIERIRARLRGQTFHANGKGDLTATATFSIVDVRNEVDEKAVLERASEALDKAKKMGKNRVHLKED